MILIRGWIGSKLPDGAMQLAVGANRVAREVTADRRGLYELRVRFSVPEDGVCDLTSVDLFQVGKRIDARS